MSEVPEEAGALYAEPPDRFVAARDALAKRLAGEGRAAEAKEVKKLRKPSLAVWALNQASRSRPELVARLGELAETLRSAGSSAELRSASAERQTVIRQLAGAAAAALEQGGHAGGGPASDRVTRTLLALSTEAAAHEAFARGMLEKELEPELELGFPVPESARVDEAEGEPDRRRAGELDAKVRELEKEVAGLERTARDAEERAKLARMEADHAARRLESARTALARAREARDRAG